MEHNTSKTAQIQSRHAFHIPAEIIQNNPAYLDQFISFAKASGTDRTLVEVLSPQSLPAHAISALTQNGIHVDIFLKSTLNEDFDLLSYQDLLNNLAGLNVERVILFDRPNQQNFWKPEVWIQPDLVERFLEKYILLAEYCLEKSLQPVFPPLQPAGDYWDTAFLRLALQSLKEKGKTNLLNAFILSSYGWTYDHPMNWGSGGPECWPSSAPYYTPEDSQDQQGFRGYEWYQAQVKAVLDRRVPILLLQAGRQVEYGKEMTEDAITKQAETVQGILCMLYPDIFSDAQENTPVLLPETIVSCNFLVDLDWDKLNSLFNGLFSSQSTLTETETPAEEKNIPAPKVEHYLLLPDETWQSDEKKAALLKPFLNRYHPVVGTSLNIALDAKEVTLVVTNQEEADEKISILQQNEGIMIRKIRMKSMPSLEVSHDH